VEGLLEDCGGWSVSFGCCWGGCWGGDGVPFFWVTSMPPCSFLVDMSRGWSNEVGVWVGVVDDVWGSLGIWSVGEQLG
jgi:hypothetical protein